MNQMTLLKPNEIALIPNYFLPYYGVVNEHSTTTNLRVVFDTSNTSTNNKSLKDVLFKGSKLQRSIFDILHKFRNFSVGNPSAFSSKIVWFLCGQVDLNSKASSSISCYTICTDNNFM